MIQMPPAKKFNEEGPKNMGKNKNERKIKKAIDLTVTTKKAVKRWRRNG